MFNSGQYKIELDNNMISRRELILNKYSVLATDSKTDIEVKLKMLMIDVLRNAHLLKQLTNPLQTFYQFENDVKKYFKM